MREWHGLGPLRDLIFPKREMKCLRHSTYSQEGYFLSHINFSFISISIHILYKIKMS